MATDIIFKTSFKAGTKGAKGDSGRNFEVPTGGIMAYDGVEIPEGYEETNKPIDAVLIDKTISENGTYNASDDDADGYKKVVVNAGSILIPKTITANGNYNASDDNADGYSSISVNVVAPPPDPSTFNYNWIYNPDKTMVIRQTIATGAFKIWFKNITIDQIVSNQYRWLVPSNMQSFAQLKNGVGATYKGINTSSQASVTGYLRFELLNPYYYVYCTITGSSYRLNGLVEKAIITSDMTGNSNNVDLDTEWTEPTFDPING